MSRKHRWGYLYCLLAGCCDTATGVLLVAAPAFTLQLMRIPTAPSEPVFLRWIGVFVGSVGLAYLYPFVHGVSSRTAPTLRVVLEWSTLARLAVAAFVGASVAGGALAPGWLSVCFTDLSLAVVQVVMLARGVFARE